MRGYTFLSRRILSLHGSNQNVSTKSSSAKVKPAVEALEDRYAPAVFSVSPAAPDGTAGSLRSAIIAANTNGQDDVILLQPGTYQLSVAGQGENAAAQGDLDLTDAGHSVAIQGAGA